MVDNREVDQQDEMHFYKQNGTPLSAKPKQTMNYMVDNIEVDQDEMH
jgi:hypothetical protein